MSKLRKCQFLCLSQKSKTKKKDIQSMLKISRCRKKNGAPRKKRQKRITLKRIGEKVFCKERPTKQQTDPGLHRWLWT